MDNPRQPYDTRVPVPAEDILVSALNGDPQGVDQLYHFYEHYIERFARSKHPNEDRWYVDEDRRQDIAVDMLRCLVRLRTRLFMEAAYE